MVVHKKDETVPKFLATGAYSGGTNLDFQMEHYIYKKESGGIYIVSMRRPWEKFLPAAHAMVATENPSDIGIISFRNTGQWDALKSVANTQATSIAGHFSWKLH